MLTVFKIFPEVCSFKSQLINSYMLILRLGFEDILAIAKCYRQSNCISANWQMNFGGDPMRLWLCGA